MDHILGKIIATKEMELAKARATVPFDEIHRLAKTLTRPVISFKDSLAQSQTGIIAEFKRRSPSKGFIHQHALVSEIIPGYTAAGASACSILTDTDYFGGSENDLRTARPLTGLPLLRKDFVIDEYQICEARIWGADVILLIASALTPEQTGRLAAFAHALGLEVLLEIHNEGELAHIDPNIDVVGVNNRNLNTFVTDVQSSFDLAGKIPAHCLKISESGISSPQTVKELREAGYRGFLMGENFMKENDPAEALQRFIGELD